MTCRVRDCDQSPSLDPEHGGQGLCYYHAKVKAGLIHLDDVIVRRELGIRGTGPRAVPTLRGIGPEVVLGDEEVELLDLLQRVGKHTRVEPQLARGA